MTILVVPDAAQHLVTALRDLSALGLVTPFSWTAPEHTTTAGAGGVWCVEEGAARPSRLEREVAVQDPDIVRVVVVSRWAAPSGSISALDTAENLLLPLPQSTQRVHLILAPPEGSDSAPAGRGGWRNVVISPEDGYRPGAVHSAWENDPALAAEGRAVAHTIAALSGILRDHPETWIDEWRTPSTPTYRVARVYYRRLDGRAVEDAIHVQLFDMASGLPRVWTESGQAEHFAVPADAAAAMAKRWWATAQRDFTTSRTQVPESEVRSIGVWAAVKLFFGYLMAAIKNAPGTWVRGLLRRAETKLTSAVGGHLFGDSSAYRVIVGRHGEEAPTGGEVADALRALDDSLPHVGDRSTVHDHAWRSLIEGALVLGDAAGGSSAMAFQESAQLATVGSPDDIVSPSQSHYEVHAWGLRPHLTKDVVAAGDYLGVLDLQRELTELAQDARVGSDATVEIQTLRSWWKKQSVTYAARTAQLLGKAHLSAMEEIDMLSEQLRTGEDQLARQSEQLAAGQRRSRLRVLIWLTVGLVLAALFVLLGVGAVLLVPVAATFAVASLLTGLLGAFVTFYRNQQRLFQLLHRLDESAELAPVLKQNLMAAVRDARTTIDAYQLHQRWVHVLRLFLQDPFGAGTLPPAERFDVEGELPLSAAIGAGAADDVLVAREVKRLQHKYFPRGWLHRVWQQHLEALPEHLGVAGVHLTQGRDILEQRGADAAALLDQIIASVGENGPPTAVGAQTWHRACQDLQAASSQGRELLPQVTLVGSSTIIDREAFERRFEGAGPPAPFRQTLFDAQGLVDGLNLPAGTWDLEKTNGLSESRVLVSYSNAMEPERLVRFQAGADVTPAPVGRFEEDPTF